MRRVRKTAQQQRLNASARRRNLQRVHHRLGRRPAYRLVDDVVTTGSTVAEDRGAAAAKRRLGVKEYGAFAARCSATAMGVL